MYALNRSEIISLADWQFKDLRDEMMIEQDEDGGNEYVVVCSFLVIVGLLGNIVSLVTILNTRLRKAAANQYLIVLTASDSVFLVGMIMIIFKIDYRSYYSCVVIEYILMCSSYVSSWAIVALTIERYIAIAHPLHHVKLSHIPRIKIMLYWVPIPFVLNLAQFFSLTPNIHDPMWPDSRQCAVTGGSLQMTVEILDVLLSYVAPCVAVVLLNSIIASTVRRAGKGLFIGTEVTAIGTRAARATNGRVGRTTNSSTTRILLVVPVVYTLLNTPFYFMRILDTLALNLFNSKAFSVQELSPHPVAIFFYNSAHYLYYVNFASDFLVYAFSSANFRKSVCLAWGKLLCPKWEENRRRRRQATGAEFDTGVTSRRTGYVVCRTNGSG